MKTPQHSLEAASGLPLPRSLDETSRRGIEEAPVAMRRLIALIPRNFGYVDEINLVFHPYDAQ